VLDRVLSYVRHHGLMRPGDRVGVAVSGGADSVALLRLLLEARAELGIVLSVVHFNHRIRGADADADEQFVRDLARGFDLEFHSGSADTPAYAREHKLSLEAAGRELRYGYFWKLMDRETGALDRLATAHTRDDQAETVLLKFLRGAWTKGLSGIAPSIGTGIAFSPDVPLPAQIVRPLLGIPRDDVRDYLNKLNQPWREDATNDDVSYLRNRVRRELLPLLKCDYNPNIVGILSDMAEVAAAEEHYWTFQTMKPYLDFIRPVRDKFEAALRGGPVNLEVGLFANKPLALRRRLMRLLTGFIGRSLDLRQTDALLEIATGEGLEGKAVSLPLNWEAVRRGQELCFGRKCLKPEAAYNLALAVPGQLQIGRRCICAALVQGENLHGTRRSEDLRATSALLDPVLAKGGLYVRNWHAGDRYWPAHTSQPKKVKELLQARHIPRELKPYWPVVVSGEDIVWIPGFDAPERFRIREGDSKGLLLEEVPLGQSREKEP
jgi:tRNA(Ile)-lysidine synthase